MTDPAGRSDQRDPGPLADAGWLALAVVSLLALVGQLVSFAVTVAVGPRGLNLVLIAGGAVVCWWFHRGAYLRTRWGRPAPGTGPPWQEPALTERRAVGYIWLGGACVIAAAIAVAWQASR